LVFHAGRYVGCDITEAFAYRCAFLTSQLRNVQWSHVAVAHFVCNFGWPFLEYGALCAGEGEEQQILLAVLLYLLTTESEHKELCVRESVNY